MSAADPFTRMAEALNAIRGMRFFNRLEAAGIACGSFSLNEDMTAMERILDRLDRKGLEKLEGLLGEFLESFSKADTGKLSLSEDFLVYGIFLFSMNEALTGEISRISNDEADAGKEYKRKMAGIRDKWLADRKAYMDRFYVLPPEKRARAKAEFGKTGEATKELWKKLEGYVIEEAGDDWIWEVNSTEDFLERLMAHLAKVYSKHLDDEDIADLIEDNKSRSNFSYWLFGKKDAISASLKKKNYENKK